MTHPYLLAFYIIGLLATASVVLHAINSKRYNRTLLIFIYFIFFGTYIQEEGVITKSGFADFFIFTIAFMALSGILEHYFPDTKDSTNIKDKEETKEK